MKPSVKHFFSSRNLQSWEIAAIKELEGIGSIEKLTFEKAGLKMKPYYTAEDATSSQLPPLQSSMASYTDARHWVNMPKVLVEDEKEANALALFHLQNGADGIYFVLNGSSAKPETLLDKIELPYCSVSFLATSTHAPFLASFHAYAEKKYDKNQINGNIYWNSNPDYDLVKKFKNWKGYQSRGIIVASQSKAEDEIANALNNAVGEIEKLLSADLSIEEAFSQVSFSFSIGNDFFLEAIKLRVVRVLWSSIASAYNIQLEKPVFIHALSPAWVNPAFQPHGNLIKETYSAFASILGGCNGLTLDLEVQDHPMMSRVARNISSVLREESFLSLVADPLAGSYFVESVSHQLAEKSWGKFQELTRT